MHGKSAPGAISISILGIVLVPNKKNSAEFSALNLKPISSYLKKLFFRFFFLFSIVKKLTND